MNVAEKEPKQIPFSICHETLKNCHNKASSNLAWMAKNDSPPFQLSIKTGFDFEKCYSNWFLQNAKRLEVTNSGQDVKGFIYMPMKQKREICIFGNHLF